MARALIVDDESDITSLVSLSLESAGLDTAVAAVIFGRVPFFFYLLHLLLLHSLAVVLGVAQGFEWTQFISPFWKFPKPFGLSLGWVYVAWAGAVLLLYLPSRWFSGLKSRRREWWLSYL